jgi:hypothetical protein
MAPHDRGRAERYERTLLAADDAEVFSFPACSILNSQKFCLRCIFFANINTVGVKMDRSWRATLSPRELASLRALRRDAKVKFRPVIVRCFWRWA